MSSDVADANTFMAEVIAPLYRGVRGGENNKLAFEGRVRRMNIVARLDLVTLSLHQ
jgi:hypothetical protein